MHIGLASQCSSPGCLANSPVPRGSAQARGISLESDWVAKTTPRASPVDRHQTLGCVPLPGKQRRWHVALAKCRANFPFQSLDTTYKIPGSCFLGRVVSGP
uniref:Uncharacterized protein n=1 Tax=Cacopsylla melanoneura TaxID=428564 RepID=A0A8D8R294_9HEMI